MKSLLRKIIDTGLLCTLCMTMTAQPVNQKSIEWFKDAKFGLFLHWGLYSQTAGDWKGRPARGGAHFMLQERIPLKEYALIANDFNPVGYNAKEWVKVAKKAGMKYIVITSKHHDGFAMYDSQCSDYNIVKRTPYAKDPMKELVAACHKQGLKFGFYYSLGRDWEDPDVPTNWPVKGGRSNTWDYPNEDNKNLSAYIERKVKPQLRELLTNYGKIDIIWFDTPELVTISQSKEIRELIHSIQPDCLINARIGNGLGDFTISEQVLPEQINNTPWESCITMGKSWDYNRYDTVYKKPDVIIRHLVDIVSKGGNLLLNITPDGSGRFPKLTQPGLEALHNWMNKNGEAIYKSKPWRTFGENLDVTTQAEKLNKDFNDAIYDGTPQAIIPDFRYTTKKDCVYVIVRHVKDTTFILHSFKKSDEVKAVECLGENDKIIWQMTGNGLSITLNNPISAFPIYTLKVTLQNNQQ